VAGHSTPLLEFRRCHLELTAQFAEILPAQ
jgi:hypothetical protein